MPPHPSATTGAHFEKGGERLMAIEVAHYLSAGDLLLAHCAAIRS